MTQLFKVCTKCNKTLKCNVDYFHKQAKGLYGYKSSCKSCEKIARQKRALTEDYKKKKRKYMVKWRKNNPEKAKAISKRNYNLYCDENNAKRRWKYKNDPDYKQRKLNQEKRYAESGRRKEINQKPEQMEKARIRSAKRRKNPILYNYDKKRNNEWRKKHKDELIIKAKAKRDNLSDSYVSYIISKSIDKVSRKGVDKRLIELKREIIKINRTIKQEQL